MKIYYSVILLFSLSILLQAQIDSTIIELNGIEDPSGKTHLVYEARCCTFTLGFEGVDTNRISINYFNPSKLQDSLIFYEDNLFIHGYNIIRLLDYATGWDKGIIFNTAGLRLGPWFNNYAFININNLACSFSFNGTGLSGINGPVISRIDFSNSDPHRIFASFAFYDSALNNFGLIESNNGGWSWGDDSINTVERFGTNIVVNIKEYIPFYMLSVIPFKDSTMFGLDSSLNLIKTFDGGISSEIVDDNKYWDKIDIDFYYDRNQSAIYVLSKKSGIYYLLRSEDKGNPGTWDLLLQSSKEINFSIDDSVSGVAYYSSGKNLYKTEDYGSSFNVVDEYDLNITGIYKKPVEDTLYVSTPYYIYKSMNGQKEIIKSVSTDNSLQYYPLSIGDKWTYKVTGIAYTEEAEEIDYSFTKEVVRNVLLSNGKTYYESKITRSDIENLIYTYERIDSAEGRVYQMIDGTEVLKFDFKHVPGDTIEQYVDFYGHLVNTVYARDSLVKYDDQWFPSKKYTAWYEDFYLVTARLGLMEYSYTFDFGFENCELMGAYVNGNYYGDTLAVHVDDKRTEQPTEFHLYQNYPNPFNPTTTIKYTIPADLFPLPGELAPIYRGVGGGLVTLKIYDILGREVATLVNEQQRPGIYNVKLDASGLASGVYYCRLQTGSYSETRKMVLLR